MIPELTTKTKSTLLLAGTLLAGMLLGALLNGLIVRNRLEQIAQMRSQPGFVSRFENDLQPMDEKQRGAIRAILRKSAIRSNTIMNQFDRMMSLHVDSVKKELEPLLTRDQIDRLERRMKMPPRFGPRPPFPGPKEPGRLPGPTPPDFFPTRDSSALPPF